MDILNIEGKREISLQVPEGKIAKINHIMIGHDKYRQRMIEIFINDVQFMTFDAYLINPCTLPKRPLVLEGHYLDEKDTIRIKDSSDIHTLRISFILKDKI